MKEIIKAALLTCVLVFSSTWVFLTNVLNALNEFWLLQGLKNLPLILAAIMSIICSFASVYFSAINRITKLENWLISNVDKMIIIFVLANGFFYSIKSTLTWSFTDIKDLLSLEWTIFGISVTIFIVWMVSVTDYLNPKKPKNPIRTSLNPIEMSKFIQDKSLYFPQAKLLLSTIYMLFWNLLFLVFTTIIIYGVYAKATVLSQNAVVFTLFLCTNTILELMCDLKKFFGEKSDYLLKDARVTNLDIDVQNSIHKRGKDVLIAIEIIDDAVSISEEEKVRLKKALLGQFMEMLNEPPRKSQAIDSLEKNQP